MCVLMAVITVVIMAYAATYICTVYKQQQLATLYYNLACSCMRMHIPHRSGPYNHFVKLAAAFP